MRTWLTTVAGWPRRIARNTSIATRLSLVVVLVALTSLVITSAVGLQRGSDLADSVLQGRVNSLGAARADEVERYVRNLQRATIAQAVSPSTAQAIRDFDDAFGELDVQNPSAEDQAAVAAYYVDEVAPQLSSVRERPVSPVTLTPRSAASITLQAEFVAPPSGDVELSIDIDDQSRWSMLHRDLHESFEEFAIQIGVDDLYLIEPEANTIVYSTAKNTDFATSLLFGPQSGSALAVLIQSLGSQPEPGVAVLRDFSPYAAAGDEPSLFVAAPVYSDGTLTGFVAMRIGPDKISAITTNNGSWPSEGETGETFVVARDNLMRSDARGFVEDRREFITATLEAGGATERQTRAMQAFGTTVLFQPLTDDDVDAALDREPTLVETTSYLGIEVYQARRALQIDGLDWAMIAEFELEEVQQPIVDFARNLLIAIALFLVAVTFIAARWSERLLQPLRLVANHLRAIRDRGDAEQKPDAIALPDNSPTEFVDLAADIDTMLATLRMRNDVAAERADERRDLLRQILPPQAVLRAEAGDRDVIDQIAHATVAVIVIDGLASFLDAGGSDEARTLLDRFVREADALARQRGLERIRLTGDAYYAACGTVRPHVDHAARTLSFVLDVRSLVHDLGDDERALTMTAGVDSGPVTAGLTGGSDLVYDAWGATVQHAADLARRNGTGQVFVSPTVEAQLPAEFVMERRVDAAGQAATVVHSRQVKDAASTR